MDLYVSQTVFESPQSTEVALVSHVSVNLFYLAGSICLQRFPRDTKEQEVMLAGVRHARRWDSTEMVCMQEASASVALRAVFLPQPLSSK